MSTAAPPPGVSPSTGQPSWSSPIPLPDDVATLRSMIVELLAAVRAKDQELESVRHRLNLLLQRLYGPRTERIDPAQLLLFLESVQEPGAATKPTPEGAEAVPQPPPERRCRPHGRRRLPANLLREPRHHQLTTAERLLSRLRPRALRHRLRHERTTGVSAGRAGRDRTLRAQICLSPLRPSWQRATGPGGGLLARIITGRTRRRRPDTSGIDRTFGVAAVHVAKPRAGPPGSFARSGRTRPATADGRGLPSRLGREARVADCQGTARTGLAGPPDRQQVCRSPAAVSPGTHLRAARSVFAAFDPVRLAGGLCPTCCGRCTIAGGPAVLRSRVLHTDDTPVKIHDPPADSSKNGRVLGLPRRRGHPYNVFDFTPPQA